MKKILISLIAALSFFACTKSKMAVKPAEIVKAPEQPIAKPVASFQITNSSNGDADVLELRTLNFKNTSTNADSYSWDLSTSANYSDGNVDYPMQFSDKTEPSNIYIAPCMQTIKITLTAKNKSGDISTFSKSYNVQCFRGVGGRHPLMHKLY